jgi:magnesium transporter
MIPPRVRLYRNGVLESEDFPVAQISDCLAQPDDVVWLDLCAPDHEDLAIITEEFGLHTLAVEDAVQEHQRAKLDRYSSHLFLSAYEAQFDKLTGVLTTREIGVFITPQALITVRKSPDFSIDDVLARWDESADLAKHGVGFLLWGLLDHIVDGHFQVVEDLDDAMEELEDLLFDDRPRSKAIQRRTFEMRKSLVSLRRVVLPMREVVNALLRRDLHVVDEAMTPYYQDVYDHVLRAAEWTDSLRDMVTTVLETYLTVQSNRLNEIMKKLTAYAALIAIPTAVTGFYGQNVPYPGFQTHAGFIASTTIIVVIVLALLWMFKRRDWL